MRVLDRLKTPIAPATDLAKERAGSGSSSPKERGVSLEAAALGMRTTFSARPFGPSASACEDCSSSAQIGLALPSDELPDAAKGAERRLFVDRPLLADAT